ncbi:hypothetical protein [Streptomyces sp. NBC_00057]|uniref:hypothetical protein n=1 Tax=Streptomyces sp. NBC_00057 TaxID=2975634 RepID=UPI00386610B8
MMSSHLVHSEDSVSGTVGSSGAPGSVGVVVLDGQTLPVSDAVRLAHGTARPVPADEAMKRVDRSWSAAVRALRRRDLRPDPDFPVGRAFVLADSLLNDDLADRPLTDDVEVAAGELLDQYTELWRGTV